MMRPFSNPAAPLVAYVVLATATGTSITAQGPPRVETARALSQVLKKVEPDVPAEAANAKVGGTVIADVTINPAGAVSAVTILDGPALLHAAAERALRQWTFKPFLRAGKPAMVQVILEVRFPDPVKEARDRIFEAYRSSMYECQRQLEVDASKAEGVCAKAVAAADALPSDRVLERSHAVADHAHSLMAAGRTREAIVEFERAGAIRSTRVKEADADAADLHVVVALLHQQLGEFEKADAKFATAVAMYAAAQEQLPSMRDSYAPRLQQALVRYGALKRARGDAAGAEALEARAETIRPPPESSYTPETTSIRAVGDLQLVEPSSGRLTGNDLQQIRAVLAPLKRPWRLELSISVRTARQVEAWWVNAFLAPDVSTPTFRRGRSAVLTTAAAPGVTEPNRVWRAAQADFHYIQVAANRDDAAATVPIRVQAAPNSPLPSDDQLVVAVNFIRGRAVSKPTDRLMSDIQPWPLTRIVVLGAGDLDVQLSNPADVHRSQHVRLRHQGGQWTVTEMR